MCQLRLESLFLALATFSLGVAFAGLFPSATVQQSIDPQSIETTKPEAYTSNGSEACVEIRAFDTEEAFSIEDKIRVTELALIKIKERTIIYKPEVERRMQERASRLEGQLQMLLSTGRTTFAERP